MQASIEDDNNDITWLQSTFELISTITTSFADWWEASGLSAWLPLGGGEAAALEEAARRRTALQNDMMDDAIDEDVTFQKSGIPRERLGRTVKERQEMLRWAIDQDKILVADEVALLMQENGDKLDAATTVQISNIKRDVAALRELLSMIKLDHGWTPAGRENKGIRVMYRKEPNSPFIMTKTSTILEPAAGEDIVTLFIKYVSLFKETDLMPLWFPRKLLSSNDTLREITPFQLVTNLKLSPPVYLPIGKRECYLLGRGYDMAERKSICISFKSIEGDLGYFKVPSPDESKTPRFEIRGAYYVEMKPGANGRGGHVVFHAMQMLDLKMRFVPPAIINLISKGALPFEFVNSIKKSIANHKGSPWEKRVQERGEFYANLRSRLQAVVLEAQAYAGSAGASDEAEEENDQPVKKTSLLRKITSRMSVSRKPSVGQSNDASPRRSIARRISNRLERLHSRSRPMPPPVPTVNE